MISERSASFGALQKQLIHQVYDHHGNVGINTSPLLVSAAWERAYYLQCFADDSGAVYLMDLPIRSASRSANRDTPRRSGAGPLVGPAAGFPASPTHLL